MFLRLCACLSVAPSAFVYTVMRHLTVKVTTKLLNQPIILAECNFINAFFKK